MVVFMATLERLVGTIADTEGLGLERVRAVARAMRQAGLIPLARWRHHAPHDRWEIRGPLGLHRCALVAWSGGPRHITSVVNEEDIQRR